jgi:hypothetical protein
MQTVPTIMLEFNIFMIRCILVMLRVATTCVVQYRIGICFAPDCGVGCEDNGWDRMAVYGFVDAFRVESV